MFVESEEFKETLKQIYEIENVLETCFSNYNKSTITKSAILKSNESNKFLLTNDAITILNTLNIENKIIKNYFIKHLNQHSVNYGDNCKILYFYICEFLRFYFKTSKKIEYRALNLYELYGLLNLCLSEPKYDSHFRNEVSLQCILDENNSIKNHKKFHLSVFNDLKIESEFKLAINQVIIDLIKLNNNQINSLIGDLKHVLYFTKSCLNSNQVNLYRNGFYINKKFQINNIKCYNQPLNMIILDNSFIKHLNENFTIQSTSLEELANLSLFKNHDTFKENFIQILVNLDINIILSAKSLNEWQKSQLNRIGCSLVSYLDEEYFDFLCLKLNLSKILDIDDINDKNIIKLSKIELVVDKNNEILYYCQLTAPVTPLLFVHIDVFLDSFKEQIRCHFLKALKTLRLSLNSTENRRLVLCCKFEEALCSVFKTINKDFHEVFTKLNQKFYNINDTKSTCLVIYEPLELKMRCFFMTLEFLKQLFNLDNIVYISRSEFIKNDTTSDSDNDF